ERNDEYNHIGPQNVSLRDAVDNARTHSVGPAQHCRVQARGESDVQLDPFSKNPTSPSEEWHRFCRKNFANPLDLERRLLYSALPTSLGQHKTCFRQHRRELSLDYLRRHPKDS